VEHVFYQIFDSNTIYIILVCFSFLCGAVAIMIDISVIYKIDKNQRRIQTFINSDSRVLSFLKNTTCALLFICSIIYNMGSFCFEIVALLIYLGKIEMKFFDLFRIYCLYSNTWRVMVTIMPLYLGLILLLIIYNFGS
jgi:hypothetical protein